LGIFILFILAVISISLLSIATLYIIDYHARQYSNENSVLSVTLQNESHIIQETIEVFEHENDITKAAQTVASLTSVMTTMSSSTTLSTTTQISMEIPVIGAIDGACSLENVEKCKFFCCSQNTSQEFPIQEDYIVNDIFLVEPESFIVPSTAKSASVKTRTTTTKSPLSFSSSKATNEDLEILPQRAKRSVTLGEIREQFDYFVTGLVRKIRDTAGHTLAQDKTPSRVQMSLTGTPNGNISLDNRFCDRDVPSNRLNDCVQGLGYNTSLTIPISRHFRDPYVNLVFQEPTESSGIVMCSINPRSLTYCDQAHEESDLSAVTESGISDNNNSYHVHVGIFRSIHVRFRMIKRFVRDPLQARRNLCRLSDNKLGAIYEEFNLRFYRSCDS